MERYFITLADASGFIAWCVTHYESSRIWTPQMKKWTLKELAQEVCPDIPIQIIGNRGNEKMVEELN
jgi:FlaA1/EpsC-like NDP-sugar epimerase